MNMTKKTEEEIVAEFKAIFESMSPVEQDFIVAAFTGEGLDEAVDALIGAEEVK